MFTGIRLLAKFRKTAGPHRKDVAFLFKGVIDLENFEKLFEVFQKKARIMGYRLFLKPAIEKIEDFSELKSNTIFLVGRNGQLLKLRNDYTRSIINHLKRKNILSVSEAKFWYGGFVYRYSLSNNPSPQFQLGVEKIPFQSAEDGANIIKIIVESDMKAFESKLLIEIGDSRVIEKAIKSIPENKKEEVLRIVDTKNAAELEVFGELNGLDVGQLARIVYNSFEKRSIDGIDELDIPKDVREDVYELLRQIPDYDNVDIEIDFSIARTIEEYHGLTFTIYDLTSSKLIAAGGRYRISDGIYGIGGTIFLEEKSWSM